MTKEKIIDFYCDGNSRIGYGHIRRSTALAKKLEQQGFKVNLQGLSDEADKLLPRVDRSSTAAPIAVFDSITLTEEKVLDAKRSGQFTIILDWFGQHPVADINIGVFRHHQERTADKEYFGFEYIILRDEIVSLPLTASAAMSDVVICLGGGDVLQQGNRAASLLHNKGYNVTLIQGPLAKNTEQNDGYKVYVNPPDFPSIINNADWVVTNAGGCLFETMYLGKPAFILPQTDAEERLAAFVMNHDGALGMGIDEMDNIDLNKAGSVRKKAQSMVDGKGQDRICAIIKEAYEQR